LNGSSESWNLATAGVVPVVVKGALKGLCGGPGGSLDVGVQLALSPVVVDNTEPESGGVHAPVVVSGEA
jgi:hypothetical protein